MLIQTKDFGKLKINSGDIITFPDGVYAFESSKRFVVLDTGGRAGMMQLQAVDREGPRFIILDPYTFIDDYRPLLPEGAMEKLRAASLEDLVFFVIAVILPDVKRSTVNLKSPVAVNFKEKLGAQVILENSEYPVKFRLFDGERADQYAGVKQKAR